jgi:hypothetical protein
MSMWRYIITNSFNNVVTGGALGESSCTARRVVYLGKQESDYQIRRYHKGTKHTSLLVDFVAITELSRAVQIEKFEREAFAAGTPTPAKQDLAAGRIWQLPDLIRGVVDSSMTDRTVDRVNATQSNLSTGTWLSKYPARPQQWEQAINPSLRGMVASTLYMK